MNGTTTVFVTDADNREVLEYDGSTGAIQRWYAYGLGPNDVLNQMNVAAGTRATLVPDILGSIIASQDSARARLRKIGYLPYGKSAEHRARSASPASASISRPTVSITTARGTIRRRGDGSCSPIRSGMRAARTCTLCRK